MIPCTIQEICAAVGGTLLQDSPAAITGVTTDSRAVSAGQLFIPLTGDTKIAPSPPASAPFRSFAHHCTP